MNVQELITALGAVEDKTRTVRIPSYDTQGIFDTLNGVYSDRPGGDQFVPDVVLVTTVDLENTLRAQDGLAPVSITPTINAEVAK